MQCTNGNNNKTLSHRETNRPSADERYDVRSLAGVHWMKRHRLFHHSVESLYDFLLTFRRNYGSIIETQRIICHKSKIFPTPRVFGAPVGDNHNQVYLFKQHFTTHNETSPRASTSTRWHFAFALCCHSNATRAPIANSPNSTQLGGIPYHSSKLHPGLCGCGETATQTHRRGWPLYISRLLRLTRNVITVKQE